MDKGKGEGGGREMGKEESVPYRSRLISLQLDEHMFRGPGEFAENSLIRLFDIRRASPKPRPSTKETANDMPTTIGQVRMGEGGFPQIHPRSFFDLTAFAYGRHDMSMDEAVRAGEVTRGVTMPSITTALSPFAFGVVGTATLYLVPAAIVAGAAARLCIWKHTWKWIAAAGAAAGTPTGQDILNHKLPWVLDEFMGDGSPRWRDLFVYLAEEYAELHKPPPRPYIQPELWSNPRRKNKTIIYLPPTLEEIKSIEDTIEKYKPQ